MDEHNYGSDQAYMLLTDENGYIIQISQNVYKTFSMTSIINFEEDKINIEIMFKELSKYTKEELERGIQTTIDSDFLNKNND